MLGIMIAVGLVTTDPGVQAQAWARKAKPFASCSEGPDCDEKWRRAAEWIKQNSRFKISVDEPPLLSTPGAIYANTDLSFAMTKTRHANGRSDLNIYAWCGNVFACHPKPSDAIGRLKQIVDQAGEASPQPDK